MAMARMGPAHGECTEIEQTKNENKFSLYGAKGLKALFLFAVCM